MSVPKQVPFTDAVGNGVTLSFTFQFLVASLADLIVRVNGVLRTDYTVSGIGNPAGGTITFASNAPASLAKVSMARDVSLLRATDYQFAGDFASRTVNSDFDRLWMVAQQQEALIGGGIRATYPEQVSPLPTAAGRANRALAFDSLGQPIAVAPASGSASDLALQLVNNADATKGTGQLGHVNPSGVGTTAQAALRVFQPKNTVTGALQQELVNDPAPLNYGTSRAISVVQHKDTANGGLNEFIPGIVNQFVASGNGVVNAAAELSQTIWQGQFNYMRKTGDGSAHMYTAIGELGAYGPGAYSELGMYQGEMTNTGSALGTMSGVEMLLKDSPDGGVSNFSTKMQAVVGRIAKYNPTIRKSHNFYASCEGTLPIDAILGGNPGGLASWLRGFDFQGLTFTTGQFGLAPNNTFLGWLTAAGASKNVIGVNGTNNVFLAATLPGQSVNITDSAFVTRLLVDDAADSVAIYVAGVLRRVGVGAANSGGAGFRQLIVGN